MLLERSRKGAGLRFRGRGREGRGLPQAKNAAQREPAGIAKMAAQGVEFLIATGAGFDFLFGKTQRLILVREPHSAGDRALLIPLINQGFIRIGKQFWISLRVHGSDRVIDFGFC